MQTNAVESIESSPNPVDELICAVFGPCAVLASNWDVKPLPFAGLEPIRDGTRPCKYSVPDCYVYGSKYVSRILQSKLTKVPLRLLRRKL